jgi:ABC-type oligopeptide transport system ATPase subunit
VTAPLLEVHNLIKDFPAARRSGGSRLTRAIDDVSFSIARGEILSLVGESGSGKTTTGRCILRLVEPTEGTVRFDGIDVGRLKGAELRALRRRMQMIFQDPYDSLNPRMRAGSIVEEPLIIHHRGSTDERRRRVGKLFELVGLDASHERRRPHEFSGGQRQRIGIARALALEPDFIVADEPVSSLDMTLQRHIVDLLLDLRGRLGLTLLFIAHDLRLVRRISDRVAVMYRGRIVEIASSDRVFASPAHPYTRSLLSAVPRHHANERGPRIVFEPPAVMPPLREIAPGHFAAVAP